jgi:hypothetical protein
MKKALKLGILGLVFLMAFSVSELWPADSMNPREIFRPVRLEIVDEPGESEQDVGELFYVQASKAVVTVFAIVPGYVDLTDVEHLPAYKVSLKNTKKLTLYVYFKVSKDAKVEIIPFISGPIAILATGGDEPYPVDAKKNVLYRQVFEADLSMFPPGFLAPGLYDMLGIVTPAPDDSPFPKSGGMTHVSCRVILAK